MPLKFTAPLMAALLSTVVSRGAEFIAHRGASFDAPENTLAAFRLGFEQGADAAECDIHLTHDGRIVVIHDADTNRTAGKKLVVATQDADALQALDAGQWGKWKGSKFSEKIPLLADALAAIPHGRRLFIEIKTDAKILTELDRVMRASRLSASQLPLITFDLETARAAKRVMPDHEVCWIVDYPKVGRGPEITDLIQKAKDAGLNGLDLNARFPIDSVFVKEVRAAGLKLYVWTVDDPVVARAQAAAGVDGLTTNRPGWLRQQLTKP